VSVKWESLRRNVHGVSVVLSSLIAGMALVSIFIAFSYYYSLLNAMKIDTSAIPAISDDNTTDTP